MYQFRAYNIRHSYDVGDFLEAYRQLLQRAIDGIWRNIVWREKQIKEKKRLIPIIPKSNQFKRNLRNYLLKDWNYAKHYVDSALKQAYSILKSWRRSYLKGGRSRGKPVAKKRFVRIKETLYSYRDGKIKISVKSKEYLVFDISKAWFLSRAKGEMGELILNEKFLTVTFRFKQKAGEVKGKIAWDCNERSIDGFNPEIGWIKVDLTKLFRIHRAYELKRKRLQRRASKKPSLKKLLDKFSKRERNRAKDLVHKLTTYLTGAFNNYFHGFENLKKMFTKSRKHNRNVAKSYWKAIIGLMSYKSEVRILNLRNSTKRCSRCGMMNAPKGAFYECGCGLRIDS